MTASLAYRNNEAAIRRGEVPEKYTRLLPFIVGERIVELGSAEGVLTLLLAKAGKTVTAVEKSAERHRSALDLCEQWQALSLLDLPTVTFVNGEIGDHLDLLVDDVDTLVAVRAIYYFGTDLDLVFAAAAQSVPNIVLCGNQNRAAKWRAGAPNDGADNYYASAEGMTDLLERHGYAVVAKELSGDPIVVGRK